MHQSRRWVLGIRSDGNGPLSLALLLLQLTDPFFGGNREVHLATEHTTCPPRNTFGFQPGAFILNNVRAGEGTHGGGVTQVIGRKRFGNGQKEAGDVSAGKSQHSNHRFLNAAPNGGGWPKRTGV